MSDNEDRKLPRSYVNFSGNLRCDNSPPLNIDFIDLSTTGAKIKLTNQESAVPHIDSEGDLTLIFQNHQLLLGCRVVWTNPEEQMAGLHFNPLDLEEERHLIEIIQIETLDTLRVLAI
jgi:hypothetical protein